MNYLTENNEINSRVSFLLSSPAIFTNDFVTSSKEQCDDKKEERIISSSIESQQSLSNAYREILECLRLAAYQKGGTPNTTAFKVGLNNVHLVTYDNKGDREAIVTLVPSITDVKSIDNKVVIVNFADGTSEKAVLSDNDKFSLEQGISICITKKILSDCTNGHGSSAYNKLIDYGMKVYNNKKKNIKAIEESEKKTKEAERKKAEKFRKKKAKRKAAEREEQISIQAEAIRRAMATISTPKTAE